MRSKLTAKQNSPNSVGTDAAKHFRQASRLTPEPQALCATLLGAPTKAAINLPDELPYFVRTLYEEISLQPSLRNQICPVLIESATEKIQRGRFALILLESMLRSDIAEEIVRQFSLRYIPADPLYYVAAPTLMIELCRVRNEPHSHRQIPGVTSKKLDDNALWAHFLTAARFAIANGASDIHLEIRRAQERSPIGFRVAGRLVRPSAFHMFTTHLTDMAAIIYSRGNSVSESVFNENYAQQCQVPATIDERHVLFRLATFPLVNGTDVVLRLLFQSNAQTIRSLGDLGYLPDQVALWRRTIARLSGATIVAGVVNSGKSTTLQTVLAQMPKWAKKFSIEDPVEYLIPGVSQVSIARSLSEQDHSGDPFLTIKRQLKRGDLDVCLIGEIRDRPSAALLRDVAESGHRALSTLHTPSALGIVDRLADHELGIPREVLATPGFLNLLVYQTLLPTLCPHCKIPLFELVHSASAQTHHLALLAEIFPASDLFATSEGLAAYVARIAHCFKLELFDNALKHKLFCRNPTGCAHCQREGLPELNGLHQRTVVAEMFELDRPMLALVRAHKNLELHQYLYNLHKAPLDSVSTTGKSALEIALYKALQGEIDLLDIEAKFGSFIHYQRQLQLHQRSTRCIRHPAPN
ncbi:MAG: Type II secretory pathway ATPase GspE/PulE or T4P pilus assembly pathway ATPase PilB [Glomeribacter sp. 1016415]|nr:Type II secretory pathway ATPase GspE/PulE or T4P pilus assembly pathway ATPase PilB [Glomeribacter sp. 1016415]